MQQPSTFQLFQMGAQQMGDSVLRAAHPELNLDTAVTKDWPLAKFSDALLILAGYVLLVTIGPMLMANRKPLYVKPLQLLYNPAQVALSLWMVYEAARQAYTQNFNFVCNKFDQNDDRMALVLWVFYVSKVFDFFDTIFIIASKKTEQFTFLHVYHHMSIFMIYWLNTNANYDGDIYLTIVLNAWVHAVMYFYYFLTTIGIRPWWKKYLTQMQMAQFLTMNGQALYLLTHIDSCASPWRITAGYLVYIQSLFWLFRAFFKQSYKKSTDATATGKKASKPQKKD
eukprot:GFYU01012615.1.p1 GENE.GFYU01012615.1~~GFYU01012615.1.p1  ORF type:complete len:283 (+),score=120.83 GFYU01012615.1:136-984(+)